MEFRFRFALFPGLYLMLQPGVQKGQSSGLRFAPHDQTTLATPRASRSDSCRLACLARAAKSACCGGSSTPACPKRARRCMTVAVFTPLNSLACKQSFASSAGLFAATISAFNSLALREAAPRPPHGVAAVGGDCPDVAGFPASPWLRSTFLSLSLNTYDRRSADGASAAGGAACPGARPLLPRGGSDACAAIRAGLDHCAARAALPSAGAGCAEQAGGSRHGIMRARQLPGPAGACWRVAHVPTAPGRLCAARRPAARRRLCSALHTHTRAVATHRLFRKALETGLLRAGTHARFFGARKIQENSGKFRKI